MRPLIFDFFGFLIQSGAGMLLCMILFSKKAFRYPKRNVLMGYSALIIVFSSGFALMKGLPQLQGIDYRSLISNAYMLLCMSLLIALYLWMVRAEVIKKLIVLVLMCFYVATQYLIVNFIGLQLYGGVIPGTYPPMMLLLYIITTLIMFPVMALLMSKAVKSYLAEIETQNIRKEFLLILFITGVYLILLMFYASRSDQRAAEIPDLWKWIVPPFLLSVFILGIFYFWLFWESIRRKRESEHHKLLAIQQMQYDNMTHEMEEVRRMRHDMKHHLNLFSELIREGNKAELMAYLSEMTTRVDHNENTVYCHNAIVNGLLQYYISIAENENIHCEVQADCNDMDISHIDLIVVLGNIMENAMQACRETEGHRWIRMEIGIIGGALVMQVTNPYREISLSKLPGLAEEFLPASAFLSTHAGGGYGLQSVAYIAEKYGGSARFRCDDKAKIFTTRIRMNLTDK